MKRVGSVLGVIALVTAVPSIGLLRYFILHLLWLRKIKPVPWTVLSVCFTVSAVCSLVFLFLFFTGKLGKEKPFRRYLPAWIAMGLIGSIFVFAVGALLCTDLLH